MVDERVFTASLARFFGAGRDVLVGIGDDAAVVKNRARSSVLCCDPVVEGVHFARTTPLALVGQKAVNRNLADLAAMGAEPDWLLVSLILPRWCGPRQRSALLAGIRRAARAGGAEVVGGDVATSPGPLVVTVTAIGHPTGRSLTRAGARVDDTIHVTGPLGGSRGGHHLRFKPPIAAGRWLAAQRSVHAAIDVSDGLLLDLATLLAASGGCGAELDADAVPVRSNVRAVAGSNRARALRAAFGDGEDHVLLWTQAAGRALARGGPLTVRARRPIGRIIAEPGLWLREGGRRHPLPVLGYRHDLAASNR